MNKESLSRLTLCGIWILFGFFTVKAVIKNLNEIQKNLDSPNPLIKKFGLDNSIVGTEK